METLKTVNTDTNKVTTKKEVQAEINSLAIKPVNGMVTLLTKKISDRTAGGVIKSEAMKEEEAKHMENFLYYVLAMSDEANERFKGEIEPGDAVILKPNSQKYTLPVDAQDSNKHLIADTDAYAVRGYISKPFDHGSKQ